jgi:hypothetical protein
MENKNLLSIILLVLVLFGGIACFVAGMKYQEKQNDGFRLNIGESVDVDTGKGRIQAPFVDIEYDN